MQERLIGAIVIYKMTDTMLQNTESFVRYTRSRKNKHRYEFFFGIHQYKKLLIVKYIIIAEKTMLVLILEFFMKDE